MFCNTTFLQAMLTSDGQIYACGTFRDANGSIGLTESGPQKSPVHIQCAKPVKKIASGCDHLLALAIDGTVFSAGIYIRWLSKKLFLSPFYHGRWWKYLQAAPIRDSWVEWRSVSLAAEEGRAWHFCSISSLFTSEAPKPIVGPSKLVGNRRLAVR